MASVQEYLDNKSDEELRGILQGYCRGIHDIPTDTVLMICRILAQRDHELPDPQGLFLSLCRMYT